MSRKQKIFKVCCDTFLSDYPEEHLESLDFLKVLQDPETLIWQPFEHHDQMAILGWMGDLFDNIEAIESCG